MCLCTVYSQALYIHLNYFVLLLSVAQTDVAAKSNAWKNHTYELKSGRISGNSAQHWRIMLIASGGAAPLDTDGLINGGGFFSFKMISSADSDSMQ